MCSQKANINLSARVKIKTQALTLCHRKTCIHCKGGFQIKI